MDYAWWQQFLRTYGTEADEVEEEVEDAYFVNPVTVTILDRQTGRSHVDDVHPTYFWVEGNGTCDCNRRPADHEHDMDNVCQGCSRFLITAVEPLLDGFTLADFNEGY